MALKLKKGIKQLVADAYQEIETIQARDALKLQDDPGVVLVDLRDIFVFSRATAGFQAPSTHRAGCLSSGSIRKAPTTRTFSRRQEIRVFLCGRPAIGAGDAGRAANGS